MGLLDGEICLKYKCFRCCLNTEMPLTEDDIARIESLGYSRDYFVVIKDGVPRLRNVNGRCVFLNDDGLCRIYEHRPIGCRLYPIIQVDDYCMPDYEYCPYAHLVTEEELNRACPLVIELNRKLEEIRKKSVHPRNNAYRSNT